MGHREQHHAGAEEGIIADRDGLTVVQVAASIDEASLTDVDVPTTDETPRKDPGRLHIDAKKAQHAPSMRHGNNR